jgi:hypothetical protein
MNRKILGRILIFLGVSMWAPYFLLEVAGADMPVMPFLVLHLAGVIPGSILLRGETLVRTIARLMNRNPNDQGAA